MGTIHLVLHAQTDGSGELTATGRGQATALGSSWEATEWAPDHAVAGSRACHDQTAIEVVDICGGNGHDVEAGWDGGSDDDTLAAFAAAVELAAGDASVAVFASAGPIDRVASEVLVGDGSLVDRIVGELMHLGVTVIRVGNDGPRLVTLNEVTHLPRDLVTSV